MKPDQYTLAELDFISYCREDIANSDVLRQILFYHREAVAAELEVILQIIDQESSSENQNASLTTLCAQTVVRRPCPRKFLRRRLELFRQRVSTSKAEKGFSSHSDTIEQRAPLDY